MANVVVEGSAENDMTGTPDEYQAVVLSGMGKGGLVVLAS